MLARKRAEVARGLELDGGRARGAAARSSRAPRISFPPGQGGLKLTRVELPLTRARRRARGGSSSATRPSPDRVGWKAIVAQPGEGTAVRSSVPSGDPTNGLRSYPQDTLQSPLDQRVGDASRCGPGGGTLDGAAAARRG